MPRHQLTDEEWDCIADVFPPPAKTGRPPSDRRRIVNSVLWVMRTGSPWRDVPKEFGPWKTVWGLFDNSTKIHILCDRHGHPLHFHLTARQAHESTALVSVLEAADKQVLDGEGEPIAWPVAFDSESCRQRNIVERLIGWLKESRRILTRFEKTANNFAGMIKMAFIHRYLRVIRN